MPQVLRQTRDASRLEAQNASVHGYRPELDAVRFLAFILVFFDHFLRLYPNFNPRGKHSVLSSQTLWTMNRQIDQICGFGLCLFFALSAYLITDLLLRERDLNGAISVRKFYVRRALRIWPLYFFGIAIGIGIASIARNQHDLKAFEWYLLLVGNVYCQLYGWPLNPMEPLWSISVEEQFYLVWPCAVRWLSRRGLLFCALTLIVLANVTLAVLGSHTSDLSTKSWFNTLVQFEMFAAGILLALGKQRLTLHRPIWGGVVISCGFLLWGLAGPAFDPESFVTVPESMIGYGLVAFGCAAILQGFSMIGSVFVPAWIARLGKISYGLYVYHHLAIDFSQAFFKSRSGLPSFAASGAVALVLTVAAAVLSYEFLESPFLRLKRRFEIVHSRPI